MLESLWKIRFDGFSNGHLNLGWSTEGEVSGGC